MVLVDGVMAMSLWEERMGMCWCVLSGVLRCGEESVLMWLVWEVVDAAVHPLETEVALTLLGALKPLLSSCCVQVLEAGIAKGHFVRGAQDERRFVVHVWEA